MTVATFEEGDDTGNSWSPHPHPCPAEPEHPHIELMT